MPSLAGSAAVQDRSCVPPSELVDVSVGCQRNSSGTGQTSSGSAGRSAHCHQVCRAAHRHRERQVIRSSSSRLVSTRPPDFKGWRTQDRASSVMRRTLTERPLRPELSAGALRTGGLVSRSLTALVVACGCGGCCTSLLYYCAHYSPSVWSYSTASKVSISIELIGGFDSQVGSHGNFLLPHVWPDLLM
jgi:hypothetical protein